MGAGLAVLALIRWVGVGYAAGLIIAFIMGAGAERFANEFDRWNSEKNKR